MPASPPQRPRAPRPAPRVSEVSFGLFAALLGLLSLAASLAVLALIVALGRVSAGDCSAPLLLEPISYLDVALGLGWTLGLPLLVCVYRHGLSWADIALSMTWIPLALHDMSLLCAVTVAPSLLADALRQSDPLVAQAAGDQSSLTQATSALVHKSARSIDPKPPKPAQDLVREIGQDKSRTQNISLDVAGNGVFIDLELQGPGGKQKATYLFDTGASYTTITSKQARQLGIMVPPNAPTLEFNTAAGLRKSPMVFLPRLRLGNVTLEGLLVSVCDSCATERYPGLLGINVMREFHVALDYQARNIKLTPRLYNGPANRAYDIEPTLDLSIVGRPEVWMHHIRWKAKIVNRGTMAARNVVLRVRFNEDVEVLSDPVARIEPGQTTYTYIQGHLAKRLPRSAEFTLSLALAQW